MKRPKFPPWFLGMFAGQAAWIVTYMLGFHVLEAIEPWQPRWADKLDLIDSLGSCCMIIAAPVAVGGWVLVWGDNGPPYPWIESMSFTVAFGLIFYGAVGALLGHVGPICWRNVRYRFSLRTLLVTTTLVAVLLGVAVWIAS